MNNIKLLFDPLLELINDSIVTVQKISTELRPGILDDLGLVNAIQWQTNQTSSRTNLKFSLKLYKDEIELNDDIKTALFRVYQEALTNKVRHAKATKVLVTLAINKNKILFEIIDDGIGIEKSRIKNSTSYGIIGMNERITSIGGKIEITKRTTKGTKVKIAVQI